MNSQKLLSVYLASGMGTGNDWRLKFMKKFENYNIEWLVPVDTIMGTAQSLVVAHSKNKIFHVADEFKLDKSDVLVAYFNEESPSMFSGTSAEVGWAKCEGKYSFVINDMKPSKACFYELVRRWATVYCTEIDEGMDLFEDFLIEIGYKPKED